MGKAKDILNGWSNYFFGGDEATMTQAKGRADICAECPTASYGLHAAILPDMAIEKIQGHYCDESKGGCGCPLSTAVRSKDYHCPLGKW